MDEIMNSFAIRYMIVCLLGSLSLFLIYAYIYIYIYIYYMYVCMYTTCIHACKHTHTHTHTSLKSDVLLQASRASAMAVWARLRWMYTHIHACMHVYTHKSDNNFHAAGKQGFSHGIYTYVNTQPNISCPAAGKQGFSHGRLSASLIWIIRLCSSLLPSTPFCRYEIVH